MIEVALKDRETSKPILLDVTEPTPEEYNLLADQYKLPPQLLEDCMDPSHLPKMEKSDGIILLLLRAYDELSEPDENSVTGMTRKLALFQSDRVLIAIHRKELPFLDQALAEYQSEGYDSSVDLKTLMLEIHLAAIETYQAPLEQAEDRISHYEATMLQKNPQGPHNWEEIFITKSRLMVIKRMLWHTQNSVQRFIPYASESLPAYQDLKERIESLSFFTDSLLDNLNNLLAVQISLASHSTNEVIRVLTLFSVVFMPLTFIVGVYGMNFNNMPGLNSVYGFTITCMVMILTALALFLWFKRRGWIK